VAKLTLPPLLVSLRPHQWSKNLLLLVPAAAGQALGRPGVVGTLAFAFVAYCLAASGNYLLNDLMDRAADRRHPEKRQRPIAAGVLTPALAAVAATLLIGAGMALAVLAVNQPFAMFLGTYLVLALAYSRFFRRLLVLDVLALAALYALRLIAGGAAVDVIVSSWLLVFSLFFFLSIAFAKRLAELDLLSGTDAQTGEGARAYVPADRAAFAAIGPAAGLVAVLVLALYVSSDQVRSHYLAPDLLWLICPLVLYWVVRVWIFALRGELHHDPVVFALRDPVSYAVAAGGLAVLLAATGFGR
jgi:4-hydroxybenzoate polyprenyltransferase